MKKYICLIVIASLLSACGESWLEEERFDKVDSQNLYSSTEGLETAVNGLYSLTRQYFRFRDSDINNGASENGAYWFYCAHDLAHVRTFNEAQIYRSGMRADALPTGNWNRPYQIIDRASGIINSARELDMPDGDRQRIISEAKTIRAWAYMRLWTIFDNILLDTIPTTPHNAFDPIEYKPASKADVIRLISSDLDYAISHLSYTADPGVVNLGLARALRAEIAMWAEDYQEAANQCDALVESGIYQLMPISEVFGSNVNHRETLFAFQFDELSGGSSNLAGGDGSVIGSCFQARFYEIALSGDPVPPIIEAAEWGGNCYGWTYPNDYLRSLYDEANDLRFRNYFYPEQLVGNNPASPYYQQPLPGTPPYSTQYRQYHWSLMKYRDLNKRPATAVSYKPLVMYRLAETYITGAEAHWRLGNTTKAAEYLNAVRSRAGIPDVTTVDLQAIMDEHARELCFEGKRWFFLKRIGKLVEQVNAHLTYGATKRSTEAMSMKPHQVRWPIPQVQINAMGTFPQNEGF